MLIDLAQATLLVVDIQEKLVPAVLNSEAHVQRVGAGYGFAGGVP